MDGNARLEPKKRDGKANGCIDLRLYVVNRTPRCLVAYENIVRICEEYAAKPYRIIVIDLVKNPHVAREEQITAVPTLVRLPRKTGTRKIIGTLADTKRVVEELGLVTRTTGYVPFPAAL